MVYKKYIKRGEKIFGPYYYESYRDGDGKVRTRYIDKVENKSLIKIPRIVFLIIGIFVGLILAGFIFRQAFVIYPPDEGFFIGDVEDFEQIYDEDSKSFAVTGDNSSVYLNYSFGDIVNLKMDPGDGKYSVGCFDGNEFSDFILIDEQIDANYSVPDNCKEELQIKVFYFLSEKIVNETEINQTEINETEINQTEINETIEIEINESEIEELEKNVSEVEEVEEPEIEEEPEVEEPEEELEVESEGVEEPEEESTSITGEVVLEGHGIFYEIIVYRTGVENRTTNFSTRQYKAIIGRPVKWIKKVDIGSEKNISLEIPKQSQGIVVKIGGEVRGALQDVEDYEEIVENSDKSDIVSGVLTGAIIREERRAIRRIFTTGKVIQESELIDEIIETDEEKIVNVSKIAEESGEDEIVVEYYTPGPEAIEEKIPEGKRINITGPDDVHYEDVLAYSELDNRVSLDDINRIKLYWYNGSEKQEVQFDAYDLDLDGRIDYIEWVVLSLSSQVYEIIYITKAIHLDSNKNFIADITEQVIMPDNLWSGVISNEEYVRINFEINLSSEKDITVYARGSGGIEVYVKDGGELIASFSEISDEGYYQVFLTELMGSWGDFDLKIFGNIEFDWIVDPSPVVYTAGPIYTCGNITAAGAYSMNQSLLDAGVISASSNGCIDIQIENVELNCSGFSIINDSITSAGIYSNSSKTNITGCNVSVGSNGYGIHLQEANNSYIFNNSLNSQNYGLYMKLSNYTRIEGNILSSNSYGVYLNRTWYNNLTNNTANSSTYSGIHFSNSSGNILQMNNMSKNGFHGLFLDLGSKHNQIINNTGTANTYDGVSLQQDSYNNTIINNTFNLNARVGVYLFTSSHNNTLKNNTLNSNAGGVEIAGQADNNTLINNSIWNCTRIPYDASKAYGCIYISNSEYNNISGGVINMSSSRLIYIEGGDNNVFTDMELYNSSNDSVRIVNYLQSYSQNNTFYNMTIYSPNTAKYGIYSMGYNTTIQNSNITMSSSGYGIYLQSANSSYIFNNTLSNQQQGLVLTNAYDVRLVNNTAINNKIGFLIVGGGDNNVTGNNLTNNSDKGMLANFSSLRQVNLSNVSLEISGGYANVSWHGAVSVDAANFDNVVRISSNSIFVNSSNYSGLNQSANLTFFSTDSLGYTSRRPLRDGVNCSASICTVIQDADIYIFNVSYFTTYSVGGVSSTTTTTSGGGENATLLPPCSAPDWCDGADLNYDGYINILDLIKIRNQMGQTGCSAPGWCNGTDLNHDGVVDINDLIYARDRVGGGRGKAAGAGVGVIGIVEEKFAEPAIPVISDEAGTSDYGCSEWGECIFNYDFETLGEVGKIDGRQKRVCKDNLGIGYDIIQTRQCPVKVRVYVERKEFCNEDYLWIYDTETDKLLGRILDKKEEVELNIEFLDAVPEYCEHCYNKVRDEDEEGVDCGGSCKGCVVYSPDIDWFEGVMRLLGF